MELKVGSLAEGSKSQNMSVVAYNRLRADILACKLKPGAKLRIADLGAELGLSAGAIREALSKLTSDALVVAEPQKGFRVAQITKEELEDLSRARIILECICLENAIEHGDLAWEAGIVSAQYELSKLDAHDPDQPNGVNQRWAEAHNRFHVALVSGCDNQTLLRLREGLFSQSARYRNIFIPPNRAGRDHISEHRAIVEPTLARDAKAACAAMRRHLENTINMIKNSDAFDL